MNSKNSKLQNKNKRKKYYFYIRRLRFVTKEKRTFVNRGESWIMKKADEFLFNAEKVQDDVFRKNYVDGLQTSARNQESQRESSQQSKFRIFQYLKLNQFDSRIEDEDQYWYFYRLKVGPLSLQILTANTIIILSILVLLIFRPFMNFNINFQLEAFVAWLVVWLVLNVLCLVYFLFFLHLPPQWRTYFPIDYNESWKLISSIILVSKLMIFVRNLTSTIFYTEYFCYGVSGTTDPQMVLYFVLMQILVDLFQSYIYSMLPFAWPFIVYFSAIQIAEIIVRCYSCQRQMDLPLRTQIIGSLIAGISLYFSNSVVLVSYSTQRSLKNAYLNSQKQKKATKENIRFVNLLCRDLKLTTLKYHRSLYCLRLLLRAKSSFYYDALQPKMNELNSMIESTNRIIDDLVFIIKVIEKRFQFLFSDDFEILLLIQNSVSFFFQNDPKKKDLINLRGLEDLRIKSNRTCLRILLFYSVLIGLDIIEKENANFQNENAVRHQLSIRYEVVTKNNKGSKEPFHFIKVFIEWPFAVHLKIKGKKNALIDSACIICQNICNAYSRRWKFRSSGIEFMFPFKHSTSNITKNPLLTFDRDHPEIIKFKQFLMREICLLITDNHMETLARDVIDHLPGNKEMTVLRELQPVTIFAHAVVLIQSEAISRHLREKGYSGKIILLSEQLSYFSELNAKNIDYGLQLPLTEQGLNEFLIYLYELMQDREGDSEKRNKKKSSSIGQLLKDKSKFSVSVSGKSTSSKDSGESAASEAIPVGVSFDIAKLHESFFWWRFQKPPFSFINLENPVDWTVINSVFLYTVLTFLGVYGIVFYLIILISLLTIVARSWIYHQRWIYQHFSFLSLYRLFIYFIILGSLTNVFWDFFEVKSGDNGTSLNLLPLNNPYKSFEDYLGMKRGFQPRGFSSFEFLCNFCTLLRYFNEVIPPPYFMPLVILYILRVLGNLWYYQNAGFFDATVTAAVSASFFCWILAFFICYFNQKELIQNEFLGLHNQIISADALERCSFFAKEFLIPRLDRFNDAEMDLLTKIVSLGKKESILSEFQLLCDSVLDSTTIDKNAFNSRILLLSPEMVNAIQQLQHNRRLTNALKYTLTTIDNSLTASISPFKSSPTSSVDEVRQNLLKNFKAHIIRLLIEDILRSFIHGGYETVIKFYIFIHPSVAVLRINKELFTTTLFDMVQQSMNRIEKNLEELPYLQKIDHQIMIWIQSTHIPNKIIPFSEVRQLQISVLDTGLIKTKLNSNSKNSKGKNSNPADSSFSRNPFDNFDLSIQKTSAGSSVFFPDIRIDKTDAYKKKFEEQNSSEENKTELNYLGKINFSQGNHGSDGVHDGNGANKVIKQSEIILSGYHRLSDQFLEYFDLPDRSEMGILFHPQYRSFQKVALPILLCTRSHDMELMLRKTHDELNILKIDPQNPKVYYQYCVDQIENILSVLSSLSFTLKPSVTVSSTDQAIQNIPSEVAPLPTTTANSLKLSKEQIVELKNIEKHYKRLYEQSFGFLTTVIEGSLAEGAAGSNGNGKGKGATKQSNRKNGKSAPKEDPSAGLSYKRGRVTVYCVEGEETSQRSHWMSHVFRSRYIHYKYRELVGYPSKRSFKDSDIVVFEFSPMLTRHSTNMKSNNNHNNNNIRKGSNNKSSRSNSFSSQSNDEGDDLFYRMEMPYNIKNAIHYLKAHGFLGMIVIVYQNLKKKRQDLRIPDDVIEANDETDEYFVASLQSPNEYTEAVKVDLHLTLPWNENLIDQIIIQWKKKLLNDLFLEKS
jgi:hypothetical protein